MGPIQRYPVGFLETLAIKGSQAPSNLAESIVPIVDMLQFYGFQQRQLLTATNAALVQGNTLSAGIVDSWSVLYGMAVELTITAATSAVALSLFASGPGGTVNLAAERFIHAGSTGKMRVAFVSPYPMVFAPQTNYFANLDVLAGAANASVTVSASIGVLA